MTPKEMNELIDEAIAETRVDTSTLDYVVVETDDCGGGLSRPCSVAGIKFRNWHGGGTEPKRGAALAFGLSHYIGAVALTNELNAQGLSWVVLRRRERRRRSFLEWLTGRPRHERYWEIDGAQGPAQ